MKEIFRFLKKIYEKKIIFFGTGEFSSKLSEIFPIPIEYYADNNSSKWNTNFMEKRIINPSSLEREDKNNIIIIITSMYYESISKQLKLMGFSENIHFFNGMDIFLSLFSNKNYFIDDSMHRELLSDINNLNIKSRNLNIELMNKFVKIHNDKIVNDVQYKEIFSKSDIDVLDIISLYSFIAKIQPKKVIQLGVGSIDDIIKKSISDFIPELNENMHAIDCFNGSFQKIEDISDELLLSLNSGDLLIINNYKKALRDIDVCLILLDILPKLKKGVIINMYDTFISYSKNKLNAAEIFSIEDSIVNFFKNQIYKLEILLSSALASTLVSDENIRGFQGKVKGGALWIVKK